LCLECLESRLVPSGYTPTDVEQQFLELLNNARANPSAYGASIGLDLSGVAPSQPLAFNPILIQTARDHSQDMNDRAYFGHDTPEGITPAQRMTAAGFNWTVWAESIAAGYASPADALKALIIDAGVPDLGHRIQLLAIGSPYSLIQQVGVGIVQNGSGPYTNYYTIDSGTTADTRPFLTGLVSKDLNNNGQYDPGEGVGNVTITVSGMGLTTTWTSGGYSIQVNPGTYTVTATGGGLLAPIVKTVAIGAANVRLNFDASAPPPPLPGTVLVSGADAGSGPNVRVFDPRTGAVYWNFDAYDPHFQGGVRVATGDVNHDGSADIVTAPGPGGGPDIRVFDGKTGALIREFMAYNPAFAGGVFVAVGDVNGDGYADIITGADAGGGPHVEVFSGKDGSPLYSFLAYSPFFTGGVRVAAGDVNGDGRADIITGAGPGGGPHVKVFSGANGELLRSFFAYESNFSGGVYVSSGDVNGDKLADIITGAGAGGGPHVEVFSGNDNSLLQSFMAYNADFAGGVRVAAADVNGTGKAAIITSAGFGPAQAVQVLDGVTLAVLDSFFAYDQTSQSGVFVGAA
jgi:uncharacterized protein YkwD